MTSQSQAEPEAPEARPSTDEIFEAGFAGGFSTGYNDAIMDACEVYRIAVYRGMFRGYLLACILVVICAFLFGGFHIDE